MKINENYHLTYCTNIHTGESWSEIFSQVKEYVPKISQKLAEGKKFGIGLRLSDLASRQILENNSLAEFKNWLSENNAYIFTFNGFPFGGFHGQRVKDDVHQPDWTTKDRLNYTKRLFQILDELLPEGMDGGISTSPLSYKLWFAGKEEKLEDVFRQSTYHLAEVAHQLYQIQQKTGKILHLDIEPEPDGLLENTSEFISYFNDWLVPIGSEYLVKHFGLTKEDATSILYKHIQLCYDVCHFAIAYEEPETTFRRIQAEKIKIGKIQISAALKAKFTENFADQLKMKNAFESLDEPTYLHQVIARMKSGEFRHYNDLTGALANFDNGENAEWRTHFHVPIFLPNYGILASTQEEIIKVLNIQKESPVTHHMEVETYTWEVLPEPIKLELADSIIRELGWVIKQIN